MTRRGKSRLPNVVERGRKPDIVRFCWIAMTDGEEYSSGFTWGGIPNLMNRQEKVVHELRIVDLFNHRQYKVINIDGFLEEWAEKYWRPDWQIQFCEYVEELDQKEI